MSIESIWVINSKRQLYFIYKSVIYILLYSQSNTKHVDRFPRTENSAEDNLEDFSRCRNFFSNKNDEAVNIKFKAAM